MLLTDIHTHILPDPPCSGLYSLPLLQTEIPCGVICSAGIHPWNLTDDNSAALRWVGTMMSHPSVAALGEVGMDHLKGPSPDAQEQFFVEQTALSERFGKPVILHIVRSFDRLFALHRDIAPAMPWLVHGFRGNPALAAQILDKGMQLSIGLHFNEETVRYIGVSRLLIETDDTPDLTEVASRAASALGVSVQDVIAAASANASLFLKNAVVGVEKEL